MIKKMLKTVSVIFFTVIILILMIVFSTVANTLSGDQAVHYNTSIQGGQDDYS